MSETGVNQREHSNDNADPAHKNLGNTQQKIINLEKLLDRQSHSLQYLKSAVKQLAKTAKIQHSERKRRYSASSSSSSSSSSSDDEPPKRRHQMNQGKQPALIVNEDPPKRKSVIPERF